MLCPIQFPLLALSRSSQNDSNPSPKRAKPYIPGKSPKITDTPVNSYLNSAPLLVRCQPLRQLQCTIGRKETGGDGRRVVEAAREGEREGEGVMRMR